MLRPDTYLDAVVRAVEGIAVAADGHLADDVAHCPGFDVAKLLEHTGGFCRVVAGRVGRDEEWTPRSGTWHEAPPDEVAGDPLGWHEQWGADLVGALRSSDPTEPISTWAGSRTRYFWFRRAAHELAIHRWDVERATRGEGGAIDVAIAIDGIDEFLGEFGTRAATLLAGGGETHQFVADDVGVTFTVTAKPDHFATNSHRPPDVTCRASADVLFRFVWGRAQPGDLAIEGDELLVARWHDAVRI